MYIYYYCERGERAGLNTITGDVLDLIDMEWTGLKWTGPDRAGPNVTRVCRTVLVWTGSSWTGRD